MYQMYRSQKQRAMRPGKSKEQYMRPGRVKLFY